MREETLVDLIRKWEEQAKDPKCEDGSDDAKISNAIDHGKRVGLATASLELRQLISLMKP